MGWETRTEVVLVITPNAEEAKAWIAGIKEKRGRLYVWAPRFSSVVGRNPETTWYYGLGDFYLDEEAEKAYWWCRDHDYRDLWGQASNQ